MYISTILKARTLQLEFSPDWFKRRIFCQFWKCAGEDPLLPWRAVSEISPDTGLNHEYLANFGSPQATNRCFRRELQKFYPMPVVQTYFINFGSARATLLTELSAGLVSKMYVDIFESPQATTRLFPGEQKFHHALVLKVYILSILEAGW